MNYLIDTNILARLAEPGHTMHQPALDAVKRLTQQRHKLHVVPQNLYEFWVVCTRPTSANGLGKSAPEAVAELTSIKSLFLLAEDTPAVFSAWERLVASIPVLGKNAHDARLVAAMTVHGLSHLLTFNAKDFRSYPNITTATPADVLTP
jgi:predicted nucleic acid-binding protein